MQFLVVFAIIFALLKIINGCDGETNLKRATTVDECNERGIAYYKEIGSFPLLKGEPNKGVPARFIVRKKCEKNTSVFD